MPSVKLTSCWLAHSVIKNKTVYWIGIANDHSIHDWTWMSPVATTIAWINSKCRESGVGRALRFSFVRMRRAGMTSLDHYFSISTVLAYSILGLNFSAQYYTRQSKNTHFIFIRRSHKCGKIMPCHRSYLFVVHINVKRSCLSSVLKFHFCPLVGIWTSVPSNESAYNCKNSFPKWSREKGRRKTPTTSGRASDS